MAYAYDLVFLDSTQFELQLALDRFGAVCCNTGMKISASKFEVLVVSRRPVKCDIRVNGESLRQVERIKYLGIYFTSDGRPDTEISSRVGQAESMIRELGRYIARKIELNPEAKFSVFRAVFVPVLTYGRETRVMTERIRSRIQASEMRFLRAMYGVSGIL